MSIWIFAYVLLILFLVFPTIFFPNYFAAHFSPEWFFQGGKGKGIYLVADRKFWKSLLK